MSSPVESNLDKNVKYMSRIVRKPAFCICENKDAAQLHRNREADQHLFFRYTDRTIPLLPNSEISSLNAFSVLHSPVCVGPGRKPRRPVFSEPGSYVSPEEAQFNIKVYLRFTLWQYSCLERSSGFLYNIFQYFSFFFSNQCN